MPQENGSFGMMAGHVQYSCHPAGVKPDTPWWQVFGCDTDGPPLVALEVMFAGQVEISEG